MDDKRCEIERHGGELTVRLTADNLLSAGARMFLVNPQNQVVSEWTMAVGDDGVDDHPIKGFAPADLKGFWIEWVVRACARHPNVETGTVEVVILQDGALQPILPEARWEPDSVPQCSSGTAFRIEDFVDLIPR
jgi:hypothetical protein